MLKVELFSITTVAFLSDYILHAWDYAMQLAAVSVLEELKQFFSLHYSVQFVYGYFTVIQFSLYFMPFLHLVDRAVFFN